jgi:hypothetical protein
MGITTITAPQRRLYKKFANEGVIEFQPFLIFFILILIVCLPLEKSASLEFLTSQSRPLHKEACIVGQFEGQTVLWLPG